MLRARVENGKVRFSSGLLFHRKAYKAVAIEGAGRRAFAAAVSTGSAQSEGHSYRVLLEVRLDTEAHDAFMIPGIP